MAGFRLGAIRASAFAVAIMAAGSTAVAQEPERSPNLLDRLFGGEAQRPSAPVGQERVAQQNPSDLVVRLDRLETQIRQLTGTIEQLQFRNQQLEAQLRRMQEEGAPRTTQSRPQTVPAPQAPAAPVQGRRSDVFDPTQNPNAPGVPQTLGTVAAAPGHDDTAAAVRAPGAGAPLDIAGTPGGNPNTVVAALPGGTPKDDFDIAYSFVVRKDYALAEDSFRSFIKKYPSDRLTPEATYWFGESMFQRQRYRDAAEAFLNVSTKYETSGKAPDALFRLGQSLAALGEKEAACASLGEISRKFPKASATLKQSVEREQKRVRC